MASKNALQFNKTRIMALNVENTGKTTIYYDTHTKGLAIMVFESGSKTFYYIKRIGGKIEKIKIGRFPDLTVEQARAKAHEFNNMVARGENPQENRRRFNKEMTFAELHRWFIDSHAKQRKSGLSLREDEKNYQRYLNDWAHHKLSNISERDVHTKHQRVGQENGLYAANRMLALTLTMFNKAIELGYWKGDNPAKNIKKFKEQSRDRFLQSDELERFFKAVHEEESIIARDFILMCLLTGQRKGNVLAMRWDELSLKRGEWRIPKTKNGEPLTVHLAPQALDVLNVRRAQTNGEWVFPGTGKTGHLADPKKAWQRILKRAEIEDLRIHDLRRTLGSWQTALGANSFVVGKSLGHKSIQSTAIYAHLNLDSVCDSVNAAADAMFKTGKVF